MKSQIVLKKALELINATRDTTDTFWLRCNCITENGVKYLYTYCEYWNEDNSRSPADFIKNVTSHGSFFLRIYDVKDNIISDSQIIDENGNPI